VAEPEKNAHEAESANRPEGAKGDSVVGPGGVVLDQYVLLEKLSTSRTGLIFKAQHRLMGRTVAVKFLSDDAAASKMLTARFHRAIQILGRLEHRNLVKAFEAGEQGGKHYLVMEYVDGSDLRSIIKERNAPLGVEEAVGYTIQAAAGLAAAHQQGVCHRNIKPGNLLLDRGGVVKIVGFTLAHVDAGGAASEAGVEDNLTRQGQVMGTYDYMSPEQAMDSSSVDRRADIYSLGCTLHMLLTGRPPYVTKPGMQQVIAHRMQPIPSLCQARPDVPEALDRVFQKMVAKTPAGRYASMEEVMADLEASLTAPAPGTETTADNLRAVIGLSASPARPVAAEAAAPKPKARTAQRGPRMLPIVVGGVLAVLAFVFLVRYLQDKHGSQVANLAAPEKVSPKPKPEPKPEPPVLSPSPPPSPEKVSPKPDPKPDPPAPSPSPPPEKVSPEPKPEPAIPGPSPTAAPEKASPKLESSPQPLAPSPSPKPEPSAPSHSPLLPVPDEAAQQRAAKLVHDMFQEEIEKAHTAAEKSALARKILGQANELNDDPAGRYVMLDTCCSLAKDAVDVATAMEAMDATCRYYAVDTWSTKAKTLADFTKIAKNSIQHRVLAQQACAFAQKALKAGQFESAAKSSEMALAETGKARDPQTSMHIRVQVKEIEKAVAMYRGYETAKAKLKQDPKNPEANLTAGRYECLTAGNWKEGLRKLAAGSDETLRTLAAKDLAEPKDPEQQAGIGDGWWELAKEESGTARDQFYGRAAFWYDKAASQATGLLRGKLEKRLETIQSLKTKPAG
jgi:serine/threonine protein kinase